MPSSGPGTNRRRSPLTSDVLTGVSRQQKGLGSIKVLERAGRILAVLKERETVTVGDLVTVLGENRTTVVRLCEVLCTLNLMERAVEERRSAYRLGSETLYLGGLYRQRSRLRTSAQPSLQRIASTTEDTAYLILRTPDTGVCLAREEGSYVVRSVLLDEGGALPYDRGGGSMAILAFLPAEDQERVFSLIGEERRHAVEPRLEGIRRHAYAVSLEEFSVGTGAIGAPIFGTGGKVLGAVSVGAIVSRFTKNRIPLLSSLMVQSAYEISRAMGFHGSFPPLSETRGPA